MGRSRHLLPLTVWAAVGLVLAWKHGRGMLWVGPMAIRDGAHASRVGCRAIIPRPVSGPELQRSGPELQRSLDRLNPPWGATRVAGPVRSLFLNKTMRATLEYAVSPDGRGGLKGRYRDEVIQHLQEMAELEARGTPMEATMFWNFERMGLEEYYKIDPLRLLEKTLEWFSGVVNATISGVEAVEFTRYERTRQVDVLSGEQNWYVHLRQIGVTVHRAWPRYSDHADKIFLERMRVFLDRCAEGPKRILLLASPNEGMLPMITAAQSEGVTVIWLTSGKYGRYSEKQERKNYYFPGGCDFAIPIDFDPWNWVQPWIAQRKEANDIFRPPEQWAIDQGPGPRWVKGILKLEPAPEEELDRRIFHNFTDRAKLLPPDSTYDGTWVRDGIRLNHTLVDALRLALARTGMEGTRKGRLRPQVHEAVEKDLVDFSQNLEGNAATIFWNFETMDMVNIGPDRTEMMARAVRWFEWMLGMPVQRAEVTSFVEPWENPTTEPHSWLYAMDRLGMVIHRIWPPNEARPNNVLTRSIKVLAQADEPKKTYYGEESEETSDRDLPRLVCVFTEDLWYDSALRSAQAAGMSVLMVEPKGKGIYYPARCNATVRIDVADWAQTMVELAIAPHNPFLPGAETPDAPQAWHLPRPYPADPRWGKHEDIKLDSTELVVQEENRKELVPATWS